MKDKILFYSFYSGYNTRGVETFLDNLIPGLKDEYDVTLIRSGLTRKDGADELVIPCKYYDRGSELFERLFISRRRLSELWFYIQGIKSLLSQPKLVVVMNCGWHLFVYRLISHILGIRLVLIGESGLGWDDRINLLVRPDIFVALSNSQREWAKKHAHKDQKIVVIPNGVNDLFYTNKQKLKLFGQGKTVITVSAITESKNLEVVLGALEILPHNWILLGKGDKNFILKAKNRLGKRFINRSVSYIELPKYLLSADVFVLIQNTYEAFGNVFIEAGAVGIPIVCGDDPIRREILFNQATYVKEIKNKIEVAKAIESSINKKPRKDMYKKYQYLRIVKLWKELIEKI